MMLNEVVAVGNPQYLALDDWGQESLRYLALGNEAGLHTATVVFERESTEVYALEIFDLSEDITWVWIKPDSAIDIPGSRIEAAQALQSLAYLLKAYNDPTR
jgi:hypothetical protein